MNVFTSQKFAALKPRYITVVLRSRVIMYMTAHLADGSRFDL
jgi:hypothetical protein